jgi:hypothetical protein
LAEDEFKYLQAALGASGGEPSPELLARLDRFDEIIAALPPAEDEL